jgi:hypothetical protein
MCVVNRKMFGEAVKILLGREEEFCDSLNHMGSTFEI